MKKLYRFQVGCGRMGDLLGIFVREEAEVKALIGKRVEFGEVLGKHSDIGMRMEEDHFKEMTDDPSFIAKFEEFELATGINPFGYLEE